MFSTSTQHIESGEKRSLKIAVLVRLFPNIVQTYVLNHIISLMRSGADISIVAEKDPKQKEVHPNVEQYDLKSKTLYLNATEGSILSTLLTPPIVGYRYMTLILKIVFSNLWRKRGVKYSMQTLLRVKILAHGHLDLAHSHSLFNSYQYLFLKDIFSIPLVTTFHGLIPNSAKMLDSDKVNAVLEASDVFYVNTVFASRELIGIGCPKDKIQIIPQGTNTDDFPFVQRSIQNNRRIVILSVGRLSIEKGFHVAIDAIADLQGRHPNIEYRIVGTGPEEQSLQKQIDSLRLNDNVKLLGPASTSELYSHYFDAHIFVLPSINLRNGSHTETQGVVLQEAQSSGIPVVASKTGGIPEIIHDRKTGLLFVEEDHEQLSHLLDLLINDKELYKALAENARKDVEENLSTAVINRRILASYQTILHPNI